MSMPTQSFAQDSIWRPLIHVLPDQQAFLVNPGTTIPATRLKPGWHWHWPLLTSIRQVHFNPITCTFSAKNRGLANSVNDEAITAVSLDHHLFTVQGTITLQLDPKASAETLAKFNRHSNSRLVRPLIRQFIRQAVASLPSGKISKESLDQLLVSLPTGQFTTYGVVVKEVSLTSVKQFKPLLQTKALET